VHGFQDDKNVVRALFHLGALIPMAAILDVQRV